MTYLNIFIFRLVFLSFPFVLSYDFNVIQPSSKTVQPDQTVSISCKHDSYGSKLRDIRLYRISKNMGEVMLCQKGQRDCKNIKYKENSSEFVFILHKLGPEVKDFAYQCEITVEKDYIDYTRRGHGTNLVYAVNKIEPTFQTVNPTASISCEYNAEGFTLQNVQLYRISQNATEEMLCQKEEKVCPNVYLYQKNSNEFVFMLLNLGQEAMDYSYQCRITVRRNDVDFIEPGKPVKLQEGEKECPSAKQADVHWTEISWILIGLLTLIFLYSCVITCLFIRKTVTIWEISKANENSTYVIMNPPTQRNNYSGIYEMQMS